jgi:hypothetical protein
LNFLTIETVLSLTVISFLISVISTYIFGLTITNKDLETIEKGEIPESNKLIILSTICITSGYLFKGGVIITLALLVKKLLD